MFNVEEMLIKLGKIHDRIERMSGGKEKFLLTMDYISYCSLLYNLVPEGCFPYNYDEFMDEGSYKKYKKYFKKEVEDICNSLGVVRELFIETDKINQKHGLVKEIKLDDEINSQLGAELLHEFFMGMPDGISKVYQEVCENNLLFTNEGESSAYNTYFSGCATVKCQGEFKKYYTYMALAHELGHCYHFRLNMNSNNFIFLGADCEVSSIFMEMLFNQFVDNELYGKEYGIRCLLRRQTEFADWLKFQRMVVENCEWVKANEVNSFIGILNYKDMSDRDREMLIDNKIELSDDEKELGHFVVYNNIAQYRYMISNLIASYLVNVYLNDKKEGLRMLKDYLMLPPNVSLEERIKMFEIPGDSYKKLIKKVSNYGKNKGIL